MFSSIKKTLGNISALVLAPVRALFRKKSSLSKGITLNTPSIPESFLETSEKDLKSDPHEMDHDGTFNVKDNK